MQDANGNLLFYIADSYIYDAEGNFIDQMHFPNNPGTIIGGYPQFLKLLIEKH